MAPLTTLDPPLPSSSSPSFWLSEDWLSVLSGLGFWLTLAILCSACCRSLVRSFLRGWCGEVCWDGLAAMCPMCVWYLDCRQHVQIPSEDTSSTTSTYDAEFDDEERIMDDDSMNDLEGAIFQDSPPNYDFALLMPKPDYSVLPPINLSTYTGGENSRFLNPEFNVTDELPSYSEYTSQVQNETFDTNTANQQDCSCEQCAVCTCTCQNADRQCTQTCDHVDLQCTRTSQNENRQCTHTCHNCYPQSTHTCHIFGPQCTQVLQFITRPNPAYNGHRILLGERIQRVQTAVEAPGPDKGSHSEGELPSYSETLLAHPSSSRLSSIAEGDAC